MVYNLDHSKMKRFIKQGYPWIYMLSVNTNFRISKMKRFIKDGYP